MHPSSKNRRNWKWPSNPIPYNTTWTDIKHLLVKSYEFATKKIKQNPQSYLNCNHQHELNHIGICITPDQIIRK